MLHFNDQLSKTRGSIVEFLDAGLFFWFIGLIRGVQDKFEVHVISRMHKSYAHDEVRFLHLIPRVSSYCRRGFVQSIGENPSLQFARTLISNLRDRFVFCVFFLREGSKQQL